MNASAIEVTAWCGHTLRQTLIVGLILMSLMASLDHAQAETIPATRHWGWLRDWTPPWWPTSRCNPGYSFDTTDEFGCAPIAEACHPNAGQQNYSPFVGIAGCGIQTANGRFAGAASSWYTCPPNQNWVLTENACTRTDQETYTLTLTSDRNNTEPSQPIGFAATVKNKSDGLPPEKAVEIKISLTVDDTSGGHDHGDSTRPRGSIGSKECTTDDTCVTLTATANSGVVTFDFKPTDASGTHTITATCDKCSGGNDNTKTVEVKVDGLMPIPASTFYTLIEPDPDSPGEIKVIGSTRQHRGDNNHYLIPAAAEVLWRIAVSYQAEQQFKLLNPITGLPMVDPLTGFPVAPPVLHVNDASLMWGGKFDINGSWKGDHQEHRRGTVVDIRANNKTTAIPPDNLKVFGRLAARYHADAYLESPSLDRRHYHLRLLNRKE